MSSTAIIAIAGAILLVMFCNFFVNGENLAFRVVNNFDVSTYTRTACTDCNLLTGVPVPVPPLGLRYLWPHELHLKTVGTFLKIAPRAVRTE